MNRSSSAPPPSERSKTTPYVLQGDLDLSNATAFADALTEHAAALDGPQVFVDCTGLTFIDSAGLSAFVTVQRMADKEIVLVGLSRTCRRPFEITGLDELFTFAD